MTFVRDFKGFSGGHLKMFDYYNHVARSGLFRPVLTLTEHSLLDHTNPWVEAGEAFSPMISDTDAYFVAGVDWNLFDNAGIDLGGRPVINLVQSVRHASPQNPRYHFLSRPALRICVSAEVSEAVRATGIVNGDILTIPNGVSLGPLFAHEKSHRKHDIFIGGLKSPDLALACASVLRAKGLSVDVETRQLPRDLYLERLASASIALLLPFSNEGFYLPALEAMAMGVCVVVPDCVGNRSFCTDGLNCLTPVFELDALTRATLFLVSQPALQAALKDEARQVAVRHDISNEYNMFVQVLRDISK